MARGTGYYWGTPQYRLPVDPLNLNRNRWTGSFFNPAGEAVIAGSPAPMLDPLGYGMGWYKPESKAGKMMNKVGDPLKLFGGGLKGLLG